MQNYKKLALAVAAALAIPAAAHADVTIYGFLSGGIESAKATGSGATQVKSTTRVVDNNSRIGFKGEDDLGNGLKSIWQVESSLRNFEQGGTNDKGQSATFGTRNTFIGLQSSAWGAVRLGQYDSIYKRIDGGLNIQGDLDGDLVPNGGAAAVFNRGSVRMKNSVHYDTPNWNGFSAGASYAWDETQTDPSTGNNVSANRWSLGATYINAGLNAGIAYDRQGNLNIQGAPATAAAQSPTNYNSGKYDGLSPINTAKFAKAVVSYKFPFGTMIGAGFEHGTIEVPGASYTQNDWAFVATQDIGALTLKAGYAKLGQLKGANNAGDFDAKEILLSASYDLSKRTQAYVYSTKIINGSQQNANFTNNPIYSKELGAPDASLGKGDNPQAFGIGLKHSF